jgi:hypothetical protein
LRSARRLARAVADGILEYAELLIAIAIAAYVGYTSVVGSLGVKELLQATAGLLVVLAFAMVRERHERLRVASAVDAALSATDAPKPWRVLDARFEWDLQTDDGRSAVATVEKEIWIEQDEVYSLFEWSSKPVGTVVRHDCTAQLPGSQGFQPVPIVYDDLPGPDGRTYRIISLEGVHRRGDRLRYRSERELDGFFLEARENISISIEIPTDRLLLEILWPRGRAPKTLRIERTGQTPKSVAVGSLGRKAGRVKLSEPIDDPRLGEHVTVTWSW